MRPRHIGQTLDLATVRAAHAMHAPTYLFDGFRLDCERRTLGHDGTMVPLAPKLLDVLVALVEANGRLVTRDELAERVWGGAVADGSLSQHVFLLRRVLGESSKEHRFVLTVPGRGYRFLEPVRIEEAERRKPASVASASVGRLLVAERYLPLRHYCEGAFMVAQRSDSALRAAIDAFESALAADPFYAEAYVGLALAHCMLGEYLFAPPSQAFPAAKRAALRALQLDRASADAHAVLGEILVFSERDWAGAYRELDLAAQLDPKSQLAHHMRAWVSMWSGNHEQALLDIESALWVDPASILLSTTLAMVLIHLGEFDRAIAHLESVRHQQPTWALADFYLGLANLAAGRPHDAIAALRRRGHTEFLQQSIAMLGHAYGAAGNERMALEALGQLRALAAKRYVTEYAFATVFAGMGRVRDALDALERCCEENGAWLVFLKVDPLFRSLHAEQRFQDIVRRNGHPATACA
jgi:DNA-binding winged helix-turn-helix (wHTH) protein